LHFNILKHEYKKKKQSAALHGERERIHSRENLRPESRAKPTSKRQKAKTVHARCCLLSLAKIPILDRPFNNKILRLQTRDKIQAFVSAMESRSFLRRARKCPSIGLVIDGEETKVGILSCACSVFHSGQRNNIETFNSNGIRTSVIPD
jgi:hypothetical protein